MRTCDFQCRNPPISLCYNVLVKFYRNNDYKLMYLCFMCADDIHLRPDVDSSTILSSEDDVIPYLIVDS
jgi:hypothetical protein